MKNKKIYLLYILLLILGISYTTWSYQNKRSNYLTLSDVKLKNLTFFNGTWIYPEENVKYIITINNDSISIEDDDSVFIGYISNFQIDEEFFINSVNEEHTVSYGLKKTDEKHLFMI